MFKINSLFKKYIVSYAIIFFIPVFFTAILLYSHFFKLLENNLINSDMEIANRTVMVNDSNIRQLENTLNQLYLSSEISPFYFSQEPNRSYLLSKKLSMLNAVNGLCQDIIVYFRNDNYVYSTKSSYSLEYFTEKAFIYKDWSKEDEINCLQNVSENTLRPAETIDGYGLGNTSEKYITYIFPLKGYNATVMFIIPESRYKLLMDSMPERKGNYYISDYKGTIITSSSMFEFDKDLVKNIIAGKEDLKGSIIQNSNGRFLVTAVTSKYNRWKYVSITPIDIILKPLKQEQRIVLLCFLGIALIGGICIYLFSFSNYKPIKHLKNQLQITGSDNKESMNDIQSIQNAIFNLAATNTTLESRVDKSKNAAKAQLALDIIKNKISDWSELKEICKDVGIELCGNYYAVISMYFKEPFTSRTNRKMLLSYIEENLPQGVSGIGMEEVSVDKCNFIFFVQDDNEEAFRNILTSFFQKEVTSVCPSAVAGVSSIYSDLDLIAHAFFEASGAADFRLIIGDGQIIFFKDMETNGNHLDKYPHKQIEAITKVLQRGDIENVDFAVNKLIEYVQSSKATLSTSRCIYYDVISQIIKESYQLEQITKEHIQLDYDIFSFVQRSSINDLSDMLKSVCLDLCMKRKRISTSISAETADILNYIDCNCCDQNFSLQLVSEKFNISLAKLSVSFKSEFGYSPLDYILKQKISKAKELLVSTESNVKEIALMVGYNDVSSFTRKFRETVGVTPAFYRKMHSSEV